MKFKKLAYAIASLGLSALLAGPAVAAKGNGLPSVNMSDSFLINIHAVDNCPTNGFDGSNRHTIVVQGLTDDDFNLAVAAHGNNVPDLTDKNDIMLVKSDSADSFQINDGNACDDDPAELALPPLVATTYDVFLKMVGKPGEKANPVLCAKDMYTEEFTDDYYCNTGTVHVREKGGNLYVDVTDELLLMLTEDFTDTYVFADPDGSYFWDFSATKGAKAQVRFVPTSR